MKIIIISSVLILVFIISYTVGWINGYSKAHTKYFPFYDKYTNNK